MSANRTSLESFQAGSVGRFLFPGDTPITIQFPSAPIDLTARRAASRKLASLAAKVAEELKGKETVVLDLTAVTPIMDFFVITTATSGRQMRAIAEEVEMLMKANGSRPRVGVEGRESETWILQDFGDIVLHVLSPEGREMYDLEHLWADAPQVNWKAEAELAAATKN